MSSEVQLNSVAEQMVVTILDSMFNDVADLDPETVAHNLELACEGGMSRSDRAISTDLATYLINKFGVIYMGLVSNGDFRDLFREAVEEEIELDNSDEETQRAVRDDMRQGEAVYSKSKFVVNLSTAKQKVYNKFVNMFSDSLEAIKPFEVELDELIEEMTNDDRISIGFSISNFMYLIRAFDKNPSFANCVKEIVEDACNKLGIE